MSKTHEEPEDMVEHPHGRPEPARTLEDEVNSDNSLQGYAAMNKKPDPNDELIKKALHDRKKE